VKTSSAKAKGRRHQQDVARKIGDAIGCEVGPDEEVASREMSQDGTDIRLVGRARELFPFSVECKNCERWSLHEWVSQAISNQVDGTDWLVVAKRNRSKPVAIMDFEALLNLIRRLHGKRD
jgi:hypothetical protein